MTEPFGVTKSMTKSKKNAIKNEKENMLSDQLHDEAVTLFHRIEDEFAEVKGPPKITLSVARGIDDHKDYELDKLAVAQKHHRHWKDVTDEEISHFHDCWSFMDAEAFKFYIPAFMVHYLFKEVFDKQLPLSLPEPFWLTMLSIDYVKINLLNESQLNLVSTFFDLIYKHIDDEFNKNSFNKKILTQWENRTKNTEP